MTPAPTVVVLGDVVTDVVAHLSEPIAVGSDATAAIRMTGGGSAANVAAWLAAAGVDVAFIGRVGDDSSGRGRAAELAQLGVQLHLAVDDGRPTGTVIILVTPDGERTMLPDRGANLGLSLADLPVELFRRERHLHLSGYSLFEPGPRPTALEALRLARRAGMTISVDPSSVQPLQAVGTRRFVHWTAGADLCLPNRAEAAALSGAADSEQAADLLSGQYREVVVTLGVEGALWSDGTRRVRAPAAPATVRDTTGAGDAFTAGFLQAHLAGRPVEERLFRGTQLAAAAVAITGARPPLT